MKRFALFSTLFLMVILLPVMAWPEELSQTASLSPGANIVKHAPGLTVNSLANRPAGDFVEFQNGIRISVGNIRRLQAAQEKIKAGIKPGGLPSALRVKPAATGRRVSTGADLATALKGPDSETLQLPSGRLITVGQLRFFQPAVEKHLGRKMETFQAKAVPSGQTFRVSRSTSKAEWETILKQPDNAIIISPNGKQITLGQLRQALASARRPPAGVTKPAGQRKEGRP
jgi:hypothetical protein